MNIYRKTVILSAKESKAPVMKLDIENKNGLLLGTLISFDNKYKNNLLLGIKSGNEIIKQNIHIENKKCQFKLPSHISLENNISCTLVDISEDKFEPILWGSSSDRKQNESVIQDLKKLITKVQTTKQINTNIIERNCTTETKNNIDNTPNTLVEKDKENFSQISLEPEQITLEDIAMATSINTAKELFNTSDEEIEKTIDTVLESEHNFYNLIADQLDELFNRYPRERSLEQLVDNSMWCRIDTDIDNKYYVVGIIKEDNDIKYICYGVPGNYNTQPPLEMRGYSQWLPVDTTDPYNNGYWVMYQDSDTGENILIN